MAPQSYCIVVAGRLGDRFADGFDNMTQRQDGPNTILEGDLVDQAHLHGLLDRIRSLGIQVTSFETVAKRQRSTDDR